MTAAKDYMLEGLGSFFLAFLGGLSYVNGNASVGAFAGLYLVFAYYGFKTKAGHLNPLVTLGLMVSKDVEAAEGAIRIVIQIVTAILSGLIHFGLKAEYMNSSNAANVPTFYGPKGLEVKSKTGPTALAVFLLGILGCFIIGFVSVAGYKLQWNRITYAVLTYVMYYIASEYHTGIYKNGGVNWVNELGGALFKEQGYWNWASNDFYISLITPLVGIVGGAAYAAHFFAKK